MSRTSAPQKQDKETETYLVRVEGDACDRCRAINVNCSGSIPCTRCEADDAVCLLGLESEMKNGAPMSAARERQIQVETDVLVKALRVMWRKTTPDKTELNGDLGSQPSIHAIVNSTGVISRLQDQISDRAVANVDDTVGELVKNAQEGSALSRKHESGRSTNGVSSKSV